MNTTFTTYAEKKAKQFLNLLQGYTKGIRMTAILILLLMGVNNAWGAQYNLNWQGKVYFLVPEKWDLSTYNYVQVDITRTQSNTESNYQEYVGNMTRIGNSRLYYLDLNANHSNWNQNEYLAFTANDHAYSNGSFTLNNNALRTKPIDYGCNNSSNFYLFKPNSESNFNTTTNDNTMSGDWNSKRDDLLLKKQTVELYLVDDDQSNAGGSVKMTGYYFNNSDTEIVSSSATSSSSSVSYDAVVGTEMTLIATPKAGYSFVGWYNGETQLSTNATYSYCIYDTKTIKAKFKENTYSLTVEAGEGIASVTGSADPVTLGNTYDIEATPKTGYTFSTWTANPAGNATFGSATTANTTVTVKNGSVTVTATATENMSTLTTSNSYTEGNPGYAAPTASVNSIGYETTASVIATAAGNGYTFTGWTLTNCTRTDGGADDATSITVRSNGDGAAATVIANYEKIPPTTVYINPKTDWEETLKIICDGVEADMTPVGCDGYYTAEVPGGTTELKFGDNDEQTLPLTVPADTKVLYDMTSTNITKLYLKPNSNWTQASARFAAYFFGNGDKWVSMTAVADQTDLYEVDIPTDKSYPSVIFCRMNPSSSNNNFNDGVKWNQTGDLPIPTNGTNQYTINDGSWDTGSWHKVWDNSCWTTYEPSNTYTISFDRQGATTGSESVTATFGEKPSSIDMPEREGYTFNGYYTAASEGTQIIDAEGKWINGTNYVDADGNWISTDCNITFYAQWTEKLSRITIIVSEGGSVKVDGEDFESGNTVQVGVATSKTITLHPNAGYGIAAFGVDGDAWIAGNETYTLTAKGSGSTGTLYAYFQKAEITGIAFETGEVPEGGYVIFTPTISPTPAGETVICWELKKGETTIDNSYIISVEETNNVKISIAELVANKGKGIYTIKATLRTGTGCESGTELSSYETNFANTDFILSTPIYLKPSATWQQHDARFAVYYWGNGENNNGWVDMNTIGCSDEYYAAEIPIGYSDFKFVRLDPAKTENNWSNRWCETGNLTIPNDGKNLFDMTQMYLDAQQGWTSDNARFAAYFYVNGNSGQEKWMSMSHVKDKIYKCDIPDDYNFDWVIFGRMDGNNSTNDWDNGSVWNQTSDLELTSNNVTHGNYYTITKFENGTTEGSWSWDNIAWSKLDLPTITITNNDPTCGSISVKTIDGTEITSGMEVDWDTEVIVSIQPEAGYAVKSSSINIGGNSETVQSGKTYTICDNTTISISFEEKGEWYLAGEMNNWEIKDEYKLVDGKILVELDGKVTKYFKLVKKTGETKEWWGSFNFKGLSPSGKLNTNSGDNTNCSIETVHDGDYLFVWDENTKTLTIEYPDVIFLHGSFNEWKDKAPHALHDRDAKVYLTKGNTYEFKVAEKGVYWTSDAYATTITESGTITLNDKTAYDNPQNGDYHNCKINATVTGLYTFHFDKETQILTVTYPEDNTLAVGDYRLQYTNETNSYYTDHVKKRTSGDGVDTVSLFILNAGTTPRVILQQYSSGTWTNVTTYNLSSMTLDDEMTDEHGGVWNFIISQTNNGVNATVSNATTPERYTGKYYIRTDAADGGWNEYMIPENEIFFSSYARDNEGFDYYYCKYIGSGTNVKYNIANDYNSKLNPADYTYGTGDLIQSETLPADGNVRFMWNSRTNELVGRAYLDGSSTENFLRITDATNLQDLDGNTITYIKFADLQNWIYQVDVQANTDTKIKLRAIYNNNEQFFKGDANNTVSLLTSNNTSKNYKIRLIYNFKTNHLVCAWLGGDETITTDEKLTADMMIIRRDQEQAEQLSFNPNTKQLDLEGTAYAVMTFTKAFIQNETYKERQRSLYWVSFPFDVKISDVFGFGEYGEHWILQYYDGVERAKKGLFIDSGTYWKYITNTETILKKGVGYVLALDLNKVQFLHGVKDVSLYFPSTGEIGIIKGDGETTTMEVPAHQCTITHGQMDRRIYDSHWNLIGIPGFTDPGMIDVTNYNNKIPEVFLKEDANLGFHYEFDLATNTYNVKRSTVAFKTMYSYLVQYYGTMEWNISAIDNTPAQIAARRNSNSNVPEKVSLRLEIAQNEQMIDQTFVQLQQEKATAEFDMNLDLTKIINSGANIYTLAGTNRIQTAGNTLPMNNATVPVGVVISKAGEYTFRMPDGTDGILVELIDYETNTTTNLLYDEYTVNLTKGTFENRFALFVRPNNTATSLENINGESTTNGKDVRKVLIDNILYIVRDGQMFDARGARVQ